MTLASSWNLTDRKGYIPLAFAVTAFALGVQIALVSEAIGAQPYPPDGKSTLAWTSGFILAASALLHVPWSKVPELPGRIGEALSGPEIPKRAVYLEPYYRSTEASPSPASGTNGHVETDEAELRAQVHSPLSQGPVVAPGEEVEFTIEAEPEHLARDLEVTVRVDEPAGTRRTRTSMPGTQLTHEETFDQPGAFAVTVELDHPNATPVAKTLRGRVATYREEIGSLFETLKDNARNAGLDVGPGSTPREVCRQLRTLDRIEPGDLADLAVELEVALYGDDEVDRSTYETVYTAMASTGLLEDGPEREVLS